jgi:hypothetical protein
MNNTKWTPLIEDILRSLGQNKPDQMIMDFKLKKPKETENELLFFFKPECFFGGNPIHIKSILEMVFEKFTAFKVDISGVLLLDGKRLEELSIMDRHYGFINKISKEASKMLSGEDLKKIQHALGVDNLKNYEVLGGHEVLRKYPEFNERSLDELWQTKKSIKLRSGFYVQQYSVKEQPVIMINGFHPSQLRHYTDPLHKIILILLNSDTEWKILKNDLAGDTFPERAKRESIRGEIFANHSKYGIRNVSISSNCVHLSAGPFEALFEIDNFLSNIKDIGFDLNKTNIARLMKKNGLKKEEITRCLSNPNAQVDGEWTDLFTFTEEKNSLEAISGYREYFIEC